MLTARIPNKITLIITHRCNQRCEFCFDASNILEASIASDMSLTTLNQILTTIRGSIKDISNFNVTLSGGEPTIHPHFLEFVRHVSDVGFPITVLSNGQRFADKRFMEEVLKSNIWNFQFSIEGASAEVHDLRVGLHGAWERVVAAIENAIGFGVRFITNSTMTRTSVGEMFRIIDLLDDLGVPKMNIGNTLPECAGRNCSAMMQYPEVVEIAEKLTLYALTKRVAFSFITPLPLCLKHGKTISNPSVCSAGQYSTIIDTDGTGRPCSVCNPADYSCPKLQNLASYGEVASHLEPVVREYVRERIPAECRVCPQLDECKAACPLYWRTPRVATPSQWKALGQTPILNSVETQ